jgi:hypothetical protein
MWIDPVGNRAGSLLQPLARGMQPSCLTRDIPTRRSVLHLKATKDTMRHGRKIKVTIGKGSSGLVARSRDCGDGRRPRRLAKSRVLVGRAP